MTAKKKAELPETDSEFFARHSARLDKEEADRVKDEKLTLAVLAKRIHALEEGSNPKGPLAGSVAVLAKRLDNAERGVIHDFEAHRIRLEEHEKDVNRQADRIEALEKHSLGLGDHQIKFGDSCLKLEKRIDLLSADVCALDDDADAQFLWVDRIESRLDSVASQTENGNRKRKKLASRVRALEEWAYSEDMQSECNAYGTGSVEESGCPSCCCDDAPDLSAPEWRAAFDEFDDQPPPPAVKPKAALLPVFSHLVIVRTKDGDIIPTVDGKPLAGCVQLGAYRFVDGAGVRMIFNAKEVRYRDDLLSADVCALDDDADAQFFDEAPCEAYGSDAYAQRDPGDETDKLQCDNCGYEYPIEPAPIRVGDLVEARNPEDWWTPFTGRHRVTHTQDGMYIRYIRFGGYSNDWWPAYDFRKVEDKPEPTVPRREREFRVGDRVVLTGEYFTGVRGTVVTSPSEHYYVGRLSVQRDNDPYTTWTDRVENFRPLTAGEAHDEFWGALSDETQAAVEAGRVPTPWGFH